MDVTTILWIMGIIGAIILFFKTFIRFEVRDVDEYLTDNNVPTDEKTKAIAKTLKTLIKSTNGNIKQLDIITEYMKTQEKINKSSGKIIISLMARLKELEEEQNYLKNKS